MGTVRRGTDGFVLAGGRSSRFGSDKFDHVVDGRTMGERAIEALSELDSVTVVGPRRGPVAGASWWCGRREGEGPLGPLIDVLERAGAGLAVVLACDYPWVERPLVGRLVAALTGDVDVALADDGRPHWLVGAWRAERAVGVLRAAWESGERSIHRAASGLARAVVAAEPSELLNANRRTDVGA